MINISIKASTIETEKARPPAALKEDDLRWCFSADVTIKDEVGGKLEFEAPLFFIAERIGLLAEIEGGGGEIIDPYDAYRLTFERAGGVITLSDEYGGGRIKIERIRLIRDFASAFSDCVSLLLVNLPELRGNGSLMKLYSEVRAALARGESA